jgi:hypothetical protein
VPSITSTGWWNITPMNAVVLACMVAGLSPLYSQVRQINRVWHEKGLLHDDQYGYRFDNGTQMAMFNVINKIEGANFRQETNFVTFWDIR